LQMYTLLFLDDHCKTFLDFLHRNSFELYCEQQAVSAGSEGSLRRLGTFQLDVMYNTLKEEKGVWSMNIPSIPKPEINPVELERIFKLITRIVAIAGLPVLAIVYWVFHPPLNLQSETTWNYFFVCILLPFFLYFKGRALLLRAQPNSRPSQPKEIDDKGRLRATSVNTSAAKQVESQAKLFDRIALIPIGFFGLFIVGALLSATFFPGNAARYAVIMSVENRDFATDIQEINFAEIPVIDRESAIKLGWRVMGDIPEYVSQFEVSPLYSQISYHGRPVRVSPLLYDDIFKWWNNRQTGLPAYVLVDSASQDARIVRLESNMLYSESEPLTRNIDRYVQLKYPFYIFDEKSFEIDENGVPWWVCPVQTRRIGLFGGVDITKVVLVNASTGECFEYTIDECPEWVDRAYPANLLLTQFNWYGGYQKGWLNSLIGQEGVVQTSPGLDGSKTSGYNYIAQGDDIWVYSGVTSAATDSSIVGFMLINMRTHDARYFQIPGATEVSAMRSAEGQVQHLRYRSTFPLLVNINGQPTYFMALKDDFDLVKMFAMIDIQRYQNVAVSDTVESCRENYLVLLQNSGVITTPALPDDPPDTDDTKMVTTGRVVRIATAVIDGNSHFYLTLEGDPHIYDCALPALINVLLVEPGDTVELTFMGADETEVILVEKIELVVPPPPD